MTHRHGLTGRILALALAMVMIVTSLPQTALTAYAAEAGGTVAADADAGGADAGNVGAAVETPAEKEQGAPETEKEAADSDGGEDSVSEEGGKQPSDEENTPAGDETDPAGSDSVPAEEESIPGEGDNAPAEDTNVPESGEDASVEDEAEPEGEATVEEDPSAGDALEESMEEAEPFGTMEAVPGTITVEATPSDYSVELKITCSAGYGEMYATLFCMAVDDEDEFRYISYTQLDTPGSGEIRATLKGYGLSPDTEYDYKLILTDEKVTEMPEDSLINASRADSFTTRPSRKSFSSVSAEGGINSVVYHPKMKFTGTEKYTGYLYFHFFWKYYSDPDSADWNYVGKSNYAYYYQKANNDIVSAECTLRGRFESDTKYRYRVVATSDENSADYGVIGTLSGTFETKKDTRRITGVDADGAQTSANIYVTYEGACKSDSSCFAVYVREKGDTAAGFSRCNTCEYNGESGTAVLSAGGLKDGTNYQYIVVLWKNGESCNADANRIFDPDEESDDVIWQSGIREFSTVTEGRKLGKVTVDEAITTAAFKIPFTGGCYGEQTYARVYYHDKADTGTYFSSSSYEYTREAEGTITIVLTGLKKGNQYEYMVVLSNRSSWYSTDERELDPASEEAKRKGILDKTAVTDFETKGETRVVTEPEMRSTFNTVTVTSGFTGSYQYQETYIYLFCRKKGSESSYDRKASTKASSGSSYESYRTAEHRAEYIISGLDPGTEYEAVILLTQGSVSRYPLSESDKGLLVGEEKAFTFSTEEEKRALTTPVMDASYTTLRVKAGYSGNKFNDKAYVYLYYKASEVEGSYANKVTIISGSRAESAESVVSLKSLTAGVKYDYVIIYSDEELTGSTLSQSTLESTKEKWIIADSFTMKSAACTAEVVYNKEDSEPERAVLDVSVAGTESGAGDVITARLSIYRTSDTERENEIALYAYARESRDYKATLETTALESGTEYVVAVIDLFEGYVTGTSNRIQSLEKNYIFTTKTSVTPTGINLSDSTVYLNVNGGKNKVARYVTVSFEPENAYRELVYTFEPADAAVVELSDTDKGGVKTIKITPLSAGTATVHVASRLAPETILKSFTVDVADYILAEEPDEGAIPTSGSVIHVEKGFSSKKIAVFAKPEGSDDYTAKVEGDIALDRGMTVVSWDKEKSAFVGVNVGKVTVLTTFAEKYPISATVDVKPKMAGFFINGLVEDDYRYPAIIEKGKEPTAKVIEATVAAGTDYKIDGYISPVNKSLLYSANRSKLKLTVAEGGENGISIADSGLGDIEIGNATKAYDAKISVAAVPESDGSEPWTGQTAEIILHVLPVPGSLPSMGCVLANVAKTLKDVKLDGDYEGWTWKEDLSTPLFNADVRSGATPQWKFDAVYTEEDKYPVTRSLEFGVVTMTSAAINTLQQGSEIENDVIQLKGGSATVDFSLYAAGIDYDPQNVYDSLMGDSKYQYRLRCTDKDQSGVTIEDDKDLDASKVRKVIFTQAGTYHFAADVVSGAGVKLLTASCTVKVAKDQQVYKIRVANASYGDGTRLRAGDRISCLDDSLYKVEDEADAKKGLKLTVETIDIDGNVMTGTKLEWKSSDMDVATVSVDETTRIATIMPKKEKGHAMISAQAKDDKQTILYFRYEYQDYAPRVDKTTVKVNLAFDTNTSEGRALAAVYGSTLEIIPVYGTSFRSIKFYDRKVSKWENEKEKTERNDFTISAENTSYSGNYQRTVMAADSVKPGKYQLWMVATVDDYSSYKEYEFAYPLTVSAVINKPSVSVKTSGKINLFYRNKKGQEYIDIGVKGEYLRAGIGMPTVSWKDGSDGMNSFTVDKNVSKYPTNITYYTFYAASKGKTYVFGYDISYQDVKVEKKDLADKTIQKGKAVVTVPGYRTDKKFGGVIEKDLKIATCYKKPVLAAVKPSSTIVKAAGVCGSSFWIYNKTDKVYSCHKDYSTSTSALEEFPYAVRFDSYSTRTPGMVLSLSASKQFLGYTYSGSANREKLNITLDNPAEWREPLTVTHTVKNVEPKAVLSYNKITINSRLDDLSLTDLYIGMKLDGAMMNNLNVTDAEVEGVGQKEKDLLDQNFISLYTVDNDRTRLKFNQNALKALGEGEDGRQKTLKNGTYRFKITPYYFSAEYKRAVKMKPVTLSVKVIDKPLGVKTSVKGSLDIAKLSRKSWDGKINDNVVKITPKFANLPTGYEVNCTSYSLRGNYSKYFDLYQVGDIYYIGFVGIAGGGTQYSYNRGLKAGMTIPLDIDYSVEIKSVSADGYYPVTLTSRIRIKIKQSVPKVKLAYPNGDLIMYAAAGENSNATRQVLLEVPNTCMIYSVSGGLDCNKDGRNDIEVSSYSLGQNAATVNVYIQDRDGIAASAKGKTLKIPVTVKLFGSDGIVKDSTTSIKVKIKR